MRTSAIFMIVLLALPAAALAATWYVEADGSGDAPTIQAAVDAAQPGDIIQLGPGLFDDFQTQPVAPFWVSYVQVNTPDLTIRGAGMDLSVIGQEDEDVHHHPVNVVVVFDGHALTLENLTVQIRDWTGTSILLAAGPSQLTIRRCGFRDARNGVSFGPSSGVEITDCVFSGIQETALRARSNGPCRISDTSFERVGDGIYASGLAMLTVSRCSFDGSESGGNSIGAIIFNGRAEFLNCVFEHHTRAGLIIGNEEVSLQDCLIIETTGHGLELVGQGLRGSGNTISSESCVLTISRIGIPHFQDNSLLAGGSGLLVKVYADQGEHQTVDLSHNWWGTDNAELIADLIHDHLDDPSLTITVNYEPFIGGPVPTRQLTWSEVKSFFE